MTVSHSILHAMDHAPFPIPDPGTGKALDGKIDRCLGHLELDIAAAAETNTIGVPDRAGRRFSVNVNTLETAGVDYRTITFASADLDGTGVGRDEVKFASQRSFAEFRSIRQNNAFVWICTYAWEVTLTSSS